MTLFHPHERYQSRSYRRDQAFHFSADVSSSQHSGLAFLPIPVIIGVISNRAPSLLNRFGFRSLLITGTILTTIGVVLVSQLNTNSSYLLHLLPAFIVFAIGVGLTFVSVTVAATSGVPDNEAGLASGLINTSQQIGGALGLAILSVVASAGVAADRASG